MQAGRRYDIAAIPLEVDPRDEIATLHVAAGVNEEDMPSTPAGDALDRARQLAVLLLQVSEALVAAVPGIVIDSHDARSCAGHDTDVGLRPLSPPLPDRRLVRARVKEPVLGARMLANVLAPGVGA
jgi:hypothetical protein